MATTTPFNLPLTITKGVTYGPTIFNFKNQDGTPFDFTAGGNWKIFSYAKRTKDAREKIDLSPVITNAAGGEAQINFTDEQTLVFMAGDYGWDLILEDPSGIRIGPYFTGKLMIREINTHA